MWTAQECRPRRGVAEIGESRGWGAGSPCWIFGTCACLPRPVKIKSHREQVEVVSPSLLWADAPLFFWIRRATYNHGRRKTEFSDAGKLFFWSLDDDRRRCPLLLLLHAYASSPPRGPTTMKKMTTTTATTISPGGRGRPCMSALRRMLAERRWDDLQDAIRIDPTVSMRIDDSAEEDRRFDFGGPSSVSSSSSSSSSFSSSSSSSSSAAAAATGSAGPSGADTVGGGGGDARLRYWVCDDRPTPGSEDDGTSVHALCDALQRRTLLHALCRMGYPALGAGNPIRAEDRPSWMRNDDDDLAGAVRTAAMLVDASHNRRRRSFDVALSSDRADEDEEHEDEEDEYDDDDDIAGGGDDDDLSVSSAIRRRESRGVRGGASGRRRCPSVLLPPVERRRGGGTRVDDGGDDGDGNDINDDEEDDDESHPRMVRHTSVLTMTDAMGETPLHALTGAGSCHIDMVRALATACRRRGRPPSSSDGARDDDSRAVGRRPTVYDLLAARNYHGCTPLHFLAGGSPHHDLFSFSPFRN